MKRKTLSRENDSFKFTFVQKNVNVLVGNSIRNKINEKDSRGDCLNWKEMKKGIFYISFALILFFVLYHIKDVVGAVSTLLGILTPFLLGAGMAFILNLPMRYLEEKMTFLEKKPEYIKWRRPICLILTICIFIGVCSIVILLIIPALRETVQKIVETVPGFLLFLVEKMEKWNIPMEEVEQWLNDTAINWSLIGQKILSFVQSWSSGFFASTFDVVTSVVSIVTNVVIGFVFAIYILCSKEKLYRQFRMLCYAFLPEKRADRLFYIGSLIHRTFASFFAGQCTEACILGGMFVVTMGLLSIPYALLIGVLIGVMSLIPIFGAFIGCATGVILILMVNPMKALIFVLLFLVLQQIEGNLIYPKVVGGSIGLPGIWVLVAVSVGGSLMGVLGMILFIPLFSVAYTLLREKTQEMLKKGKVSKSKYM